MRGLEKLSFILIFLLSFNSLVRATSAQNFFDNFISFLQTNGVFQFYLPFIILFSMLLGLLNKTKIFGPNTQGLNAVIALASSFFIMISPAGISLMSFFGAFETDLLVILVTIMSLVFIFYLLTPIIGEQKTFPEAAKYIVIFAALISFGVFVSAGGLRFFPGLENLPQVDITQDVVVVVLLILTVGVMIWLTKEPSSGGPKKERRELVVPLD